jgi:hypothetical protein
MELWPLRGRLCGTYPTPEARPVKPSNARYGRDSSSPSVPHVDDDPKRAPDECGHIHRDDHGADRHAE